MREGIHPNFEKTTITCHCGNVMETMSTKKDIKVEICSKCHPFFTGKQKLRFASRKVVNHSSSGNSFYNLGGA